jgi:hypothetical protein
MNAQGIVNRELEITWTEAAAVYYNVLFRQSRRGNQESKKIIIIQDNRPYGPFQLITSACCDLNVFIALLAHWSIDPNEEN